MIDKDGVWYNSHDVLREVKLLADRLTEIYEKFPDAPRWVLERYAENYHQIYEPEKFWVSSSASC